MHYAKKGMMMWSSLVRSTSNHGPLLIVAIAITIAMLKQCWNYVDTDDNWLFLGHNDSIIDRFDNIVITVLLDASFDMLLHTSTA